MLIYGSETLNIVTSLLSFGAEFDSIVPIMIILFGVFGLVVILNYKMKKNRAKNYFEHIRNIGIKAGVQKLDLSPLSPDLKKSDANGIKIFDLNIDYIIVTTHYNELYFWFNFVVKISPEHEKNWEIKTVFTKEGSLGKKITGFEWKADKEMEDRPYSNKLVSFLNEDNNLNKFLLGRFQSGMPEITISPFKEEPVNGISLKLRFVDFKKGTDYSSKKDIEAFNIIAKYIKE
tara:strand:+ start:282 stop:977 length:696 start_codon:yes stop_codon:yes gene_type:complete